MFMKQALKQQGDAELSQHVWTLSCSHLPTQPHRGPSTTCVDCAAQAGPLLYVVLIFLCSQYLQCEEQRIAGDLDRFWRARWRKVKMTRKRRVHQIKAARDQPLSRHRDNI
eukprot:1674532-Amphidinium_carterae.2